MGKMYDAELHLVLIEEFSFVVTEVFVTITAAGVARSWHATSACSTRSHTREKDLIGLLHLLPPDKSLQRSAAAAHSTGRSIQAH